MSITCFSLIFIVVCILLLSSQASTARPLVGTLPYSKDHTTEKKRLLLHLSHKNDNVTNAKTSDNTPSKEISVDGDNKDQEQGSKARPAVDPYKKDFVKDESKVVKSQVNSRGAQIPMTVSWRLGEQKRKRRRKKKRGYSHDPDLSSDYAPPRVHPPCHN